VTAQFTPHFHLLNISG